MSDSDFFDESDDNNDRRDNKDYKDHEKKYYKTISTSDFILILLFIFVSVVLGIYVQEKYF